MPGTQNPPVKITTYILSFIKEIKETSDYEEYRSLKDTGNWIILEFILTTNGFLISLGRVD